MQDNIGRNRVPQARFEFTNPAGAALRLIALLFCEGGDMSTGQQLKPGKVRYCPICGENMGFVENRHYDKTDTCGSRECDREMGDTLREERNMAHEQLDRDMGW